jgi:hypothetical protein
VLGFIPTSLPKEGKGDFVKTIGSSPKELKMIQDSRGQGFKDSRKNHKKRLRGIGGLTNGEKEPDLFLILEYNGSW